ncbi:hypothetical protein GCM10007886_33980 [Methylobacterium gregans]|nr:hypothetical protein GCM10007886_33980 [Methylobacterium gregans]
MATIEALHLAREKSARADRVEAQGGALTPLARRDGDKTLNGGGRGGGGRPYGLAAAAGRRGSAAVLHPPENRAKPFP